MLLKLTNPVGIRLVADGQPDGYQTNRELSVFLPLIADAMGKTCAANFSQVKRTIGGQKAAAGVL